MNFQQLRSVREAVRLGFNLTAVAQALQQAWAGDAALARPVPDLAALARSAVDLKAPVTHPPLEGKVAAGAGAANAV